MRNEELRREGEYKGILQCEKAVFRGEGLLTFSWILTKINRPLYILSNDYDDMIYTLFLTNCKHVHRFCDPVHDC